MREYRGKRVDGKGWAYGWYFVSLSGFHYIKSFYKSRGKLTRPPKTTQLNRTVEHKVIPKSVGQYTGLKDKDGVKIYKGDIYKIFDETKENKIYEILFKEGCFLAQARDGMKYHARTWAGDSCKIIGNITDSPNLLESPK